jgi:hypothetical protein
MTQKMNASRFGALATIVFNPNWPGYGKRNEGRNGNTRYAHVAKKYLIVCRDDERDLPEWEWGCAFDRACTLAINLGLPLPSPEDSTLRLLHYEPGSSFNAHQDFCLFTVNLFRNFPNEGLPDLEVHYGMLAKFYGYEPTTHSVTPQDRHQYSAVFFAMPPLDMKLPNGETVADFVARQKEYG